MELVYVEYSDKSFGWDGYWEANGKVFAWKGTDGDILYAVDLI